MKSSHSNTSKLSWSSSIDELYPKGLTKTAQSIKEAGIDSLKDLLWSFPLRVQLLPSVSSFENIREDYLFRGRGKIISFRSTPNFKARGKGGATLLNVTAIVQDLYSSRNISLKWFNCYSSISQKIQKLTYIDFLGTVQTYQDQFQIITPEVNEISESEIKTPLSKFEGSEKKVKIQYPTINDVSSNHFTKIINKIPTYLWDSIEETLPNNIREKRSFITLAESFHILHGKTYLEKPWAEDRELLAKDRIVYEELFQEQIKVMSRRLYNKQPKAISLDEKKINLKSYANYFPYSLTDDQEKVIDEIVADICSEKPMMRLVQGDVGCGKTSVALVSALSVIEQDHQVAMMCPTEALAQQHFLEFVNLLPKDKYNIALLLGSTSTKEKESIYTGLSEGTIDFVIGTHSLIQDSLQFKSLALAIIDEQHKFGVEQRQKLVGKTEGCHCLIMTATPIPRSLSLTQFGDLDISTIKTMPSGRKGSKTRIVGPENFQNFLNFIKTRLSMDEQVYIVVPAINESEKQDFLFLSQVLDKFKAIFPESRVFGLHGQMKAEEKSNAFIKFKNHEIDILIATSVIEVGINVTNATIMAIMNPERFGLSSLHQLRGRVGRGTKPGFCFLVNDKPISMESMERLKVIEDNNDGFSIAEEDLKIRGQGDIFGKNQSGSVTTKKLANIIIHQNELLAAKEDLSTLLEIKDEKTLFLIDQYTNDMRVFSTI